MGKLRQWFRKWFDRQVEKSMQRQANKLFEKGDKMTQYKSKVELQRKILAEEFADNINASSSYELDVR